MILISGSCIKAYNTVMTTGEVVSEVSLIAGILDSTIGQAGTAQPENYNNRNSRLEGNPRNPLSEGPPLPPKPCDATLPPLHKVPRPEESQKKNSPQNNVTSL